MPKPPQINARRLVAALKRAGFEVRRQTGSHLVLRHPVSRRTTVVPVHSGSLSPELVASICKQTGLSTAELVDLV